MTSVADLFSRQGPLARSIDGFTERAEQIAMAEHVAAALQSPQQLMIEAGTGIGKTFAYLVPALLSGKRIIISTGTRSLQDQLYHRDLPTITRALGRPVQVALLKGRANYLCLHRLSLAEQQAAARGLKRDVAIGIGQVRRWSFSTAKGDVAELATVGEQHPVWPWVTSTRDNCLQAECPEYQRCHVVAARREAQAAEIVIINHHLLMADLVLKEEGFGELLPGADAVVIDEAHQLPDVATQFLGLSVSSRQLQSLARDVVAELMLLSSVDGAAGTWAQTFERRIADAESAIRISGERVDVADWPAAFVEAFELLVADLRVLCSLLEPVAADNAPMAAIKRRAGEVADRMDTLIAPDDDDRVVAGIRWVQLSQSGFTAHYVPVDTARQLGALVEARASSWIYTSATLAVGDDFTHFKRRLGVADAETVRFGSPFDYPNQALMYLPRGLDAPASRRHTRQVIEAAWPVLKASGGRAFLLFTSHRALREAAEVLAAMMKGDAPFPVLVQGDAPRDALLQRFRQYGNAVLLGTGSFWEGVDVKGTALAVVVIDKLPFAVPDDPVLKARLDAIERQGGNPFFDEQIPQAVIALKQGVGRLIRDADDFGVVMLCDQRLTSRPYGRTFLGSLPAMRRTDKLADVQQFLRDKLHGAGIDPEADVVVAVERRIP
ncbi:MAG: hypothetical protein RLZZ403_1829 [Pseudomonadota bacterium]